MAVEEKKFSEITTISILGSLYLLYFYPVKWWTIQRDIHIHSTIVSHLCNVFFFTPNRKVRRSASCRPQTHTRTYTHTQFHICIHVDLSWSHLKRNNGFQSLSTFWVCTSIHICLVYLYIFMCILCACVRRRNKTGLRTPCSVVSMPHFFIFP